MTARRAAASIILIAAIAALSGCSDPEPTDDDYRATHVEFWSIAMQVAEEDTGQAARADLEEQLDAEWDDPSERETWRAVYDGVCEELREGEAPDLITELVRQLEMQVSPEAAREGTLKQVDAIVERLCPSQGGAVDAIRDEVLAG